jgi:hypothetical protein
MAAGASILQMDRPPAESPSGRSQAPTEVRPKARVIIPVWGEKYVARLDAACLPALLAPGNLPHLAEHFDCELVIVTESRLFDAVRALESIERAQRWCGLRLTAMDDVLSHPSYYGYTITQSLYRGFTDLGDEATNVWCLFLNADFVLADGSYRSLVKKIQAGERCILAPSYCTIEENVRPALQQRIAAHGGVLAVPPREMAGMILDNRHYTIRAKTINWRMYRIDHVDQLYYVVDRDTLLAKQIPIAVVAMRPERAPREPVAFWDYGVVSELCPTSRLCVIGDSDEFLMMELRGKGGMGGWLKLGWLDQREIARHLSLWSTADQRKCADHTLVLHRSDVPANIDAGIEALDGYWKAVARQLSPQPRDHRDHYIWRAIVEQHGKWHRQRGGSGTVAPAPAGNRLVALIKQTAGALLSHGANDGYRTLRELMATIQERLLGRLPEVSMLHPLRLDTQPAVELLKGLSRDARKVLCLSSRTRPAVAHHVGHWFAEVVSEAPDWLLDETSRAEREKSGPFDLCFAELGRSELLEFETMYRRLRTLIRPGGRIVMLYQTRGLERILQRDLELIHNGLPPLDLPHLEFRGGTLAMLVQSLWERELLDLDGGGALRLLRFALLAAATAPLAAAANIAARRADVGRVGRSCTSLLLDVRVL